jgi:HAE1 family hydrophobic/amphiphilic exporter-1
MLKAAADQMVARIHDVPGLRDLTHSMVKGKPEYRIRINRDRAYRLGLSVAQVANTVQIATVGRVASRFREGSEETDIRIRFQERYRDSLDAIRRIPLVTPLGKNVTLDQVADIERGEGPTQISRENQARRVNITANYTGRDLGSVVRDIKARLAPLEKQLPTGYFMEYGGSYKQMQEAFLILIAAFALAALLVYMVMASQFEHFIHPFIIMFTIPLAFIGVVFGLFLGGKPLSLPVFVGIIILAGIAVNNGIVMIDYINQLIRSGMEKREAVLQGSTTRLRPVLLTALTTILGLVPMVFSHSSGSEFRSPMGLTVLGGLMATTFLTLYFIPALYCVVNKIRFREPKKKAA